MAKGYPDFFGFSMFPYYGTTNVIYRNAGVGPLDFIDVMNLTLKGVCIGGYINIVTNASDHAGRIRFWIDDELIVPDFDFDNDLFHRHRNTPSPLIMSESSKENLRHFVILTKQISFENNARIAVYNIDAILNLNVTSEMYYHQIRT